MNKESRIYIGNYDNGIRVYVPNICDAITLVGKATGKLAKKCLDVAPRVTHLMGPGDAAVLYRPLPEDYADYYEELYGFRPRVYAPERAPDPSKPLSLLTSVLHDEALMERLKAEGSKQNWLMTPFIHHPLVHELGDRLGLTVDGMDAESVRSGVVADLNNKAVFHGVCRELGIPVPPSDFARGWNDIVDKTHHILLVHGSAMLRQALGAGGLGNLEVTQRAVDDGGGIRAYLASKLSPCKDWTSDTVLVEPVLPVRESPTTLFAVKDGAVRFVSDAAQILEHKAFVGSLLPTELPRATLDKLVYFSRLYGEMVAPKIRNGWFDIDWGVLGNGDLVAFESNCRMTGNHHPLAVRERLRPDCIHGLVTISNDAVKVGDDLTMKRVIALMKDADLAWDPRRGEGVVVTIPPAGGSMGFVVLADRSGYARGLAERMRSLVSAT